MGDEMSIDDIRYFARRVAEEQQAAQMADHPVAASAHRQMADRYHHLLRIILVSGESGADRQAGADG